MLRPSCIAVLALTLLAIALPRVANACPSSFESKGHLLGVDAEGRAVIYRYAWGENADSADSAFVAYDADGNEISRLEAQWNETLAAPVWTRTGGDYLDGLSGQTEAQVDKLIRKTKKLAMPPTRAIRHAKSEGRCGSIEIASGADWVRIGEVGVLSYQFEESCPPLHLEAFEPSTGAVLFVRVAYRLGAKKNSVHTDGWGTWEEVDNIRVVPKARVKAAELQLQAERERLRGKPDQALTKLLRAVDLAPELLPARTSLMRLVLSKNKSGADVLAALERPLPEDWIGALPPEELWSAAYTIASPRAVAADDVPPAPWSAGEHRGLL